MSEDENLGCNPTYQSGRYHPALVIPMLSTIHSEVGNEERNRGEYEGNEDRARLKSENKVRTSPRTETRRTGTITKMRTRLAAAIGHHLQQPLSLTRAFPSLNQIDMFGDV